MYSLSGKHSTSYRTVWTETEQPFIEKAKIFACSTSTFTYACKKGQFQEPDSEAIQYVQFSPAFFPQKVNHKKAGNNNREQK